MSNLFLLILMMLFCSVAEAAADADTAQISELTRQQAIYEEGMRELGSPAMFASGAFTPNTGDSKLDDILNEFHAMYIALNKRDFDAEKRHQDKAATLLKNWQKKATRTLKEATSSVEQKNETTNK